MTVTTYEPAPVMMATSEVPLVGLGARVADAARHLHVPEGGSVAKFTVTGGPTGDAGVTITGKWHPPGSTVDAPGKDVDWLVEQGYLKAGARKAAAPTPDSEEE